ncbi:unnamed protein product [Microthlaspi erraticum]|uniref:Uncharacterized protein n=1 Tax=Microthlaspi erraticum TaxID=1685480 RepID=A0A6D2HW77_9BRAS|nr:unnamed protein product [Microthlaspi erraticum]
MGREEHGRTWCMDAAQLDTQRKKEEAILKTSSTTTRPTGRVPQLDRPSFNSIELRSDSPHGSDGNRGKGPLRAPITLALEMESYGLLRLDSHWLTPCF